MSSKVPIFAPEERRGAAAARHRDRAVLFASETGAVDDHGFPAGFFDRADTSGDDTFYASPRLVTHIDDRAIAAVTELYDELAVSGRVLDLMGSWVSHFSRRPAHLTVLGMNADELATNPQASERVVHDLNADPQLPFDSGSFDAVVCSVSVDYLTRPVDVFTSVARVIGPNAPFVCTFSNRCFPTKAIRGWLQATDQEHCAIVAEYFRRARRWTDPVIEQRTPPLHLGDPLFAVWAYREPEVTSGSQEQRAEHLAGRGTLARSPLDVDSVLRGDEHGA